MLHNYLTLAFRNLRRNGRYMIINMLGLGVALAFCILSFTNYRFAHTYDRWHHDADRIFRVESYKASNHLLHGVAPAMITDVATAEIPGVEAATRIDSRGLVVKRDENVFTQQVHFVDDNFLDVFDFPLLRGQARLSDPNALLLDEEMAKKFFGDTDPVGQPLILYADMPERKALTVTGVFKKCPKNSSLQMQFLTRLENQLEGDKPVRYDSWRWMVDAAFLKLKSPADAPAVEAALQAYVAPQQQGNQNWQAERYVLEALTAMALTSRDLRWNNLYDGLPPSAIWGNITIAVMLLLTACFNFANTTVAVGNRRLREMGVRKAMGGTQRQLMRQLLGEAFVVCFVSLLLAMLITPPFMDWYSATWKHIELKVDYRDVTLLAFLAFAVAGTTLLAGAYPSFYISSFNPSTIFRGSLRFGGASLFSRLLMGAQVTISLAAVVVGFSFARNAQVQRGADLGYARESLLGVDNQNAAELKTFEDVLRRNPKVIALAGTRHHVGFSYRRSEFIYRGEKAETAWFDLGKDYMGLVGMEIKTGQGFSQNTETAGSTDVLVNETFVREIAGGKDVLGQTLQFDSASYRVAGVVKDFMADSPFDPMAPVVLHCVPEDKFMTLVVKAKPEDLTAVYADMEKTWKGLFPYKPFPGFYQSEVLAEALEVSDNIANMMLIFAFVILLLTISGLYTIVSLNALKQRRGLAIRRVLGATSGNIAYHLNRNFLYVMLGATLLGCLAGRIFALAMMNSIYKIHAGVQGGVLLFASFCVLSVMGATVGVKVWQLLKANPAEALKVE